MKVTIIKGPLYEQREKKAHELIYNIVKKKMQLDNERNNNKN